jgi:hypothetical protein
MSNESEGGSSVRSRIITKEDEEAEFIADSDIEDATSVVSLGTKQHIDTEEFETNIEPEVSFLKYESQPQQKRGYIDEEIVRNVMKGADERLMDQKMNTTFNRRMKLCAGILGLTVFSLGIATLVVDSKDRNIDKIIKDKGTAYDFHDEDNFIDPELEEGYNFWDKEVFLEPGVIFPPAIMFNLEDTKEGRYMKEEETPFFFQVPFR